MFGFMKKLTKLLPKEATLPGRKERVHVPERHFVNGNRIVPPFPDGMALAQLGMGCFWAPSACSGRRRRLSTAVATRGRHGEPDLRGSVHRVPPTTPRWCSWCSTRKVS